MSPEMKLLLIAAAITIGGAWWGWYIIKPKKLLPPHDPRCERGKPGAVP